MKQPHRLKHSKTGKLHPYTFSCFDHAIAFRNEQYTKYNDIYLFYNYVPVLASEVKE